MNSLYDRLLKDASINYKDYINDYGSMHDYVNQWMYRISEINECLEEQHEPTIEEKVVDIVKGGFEEKFGMTIQEFQEVYERIIETEPEKLI